MGKPNVGRAGSGVSYVGLRNGRKTWRARLYWIDPRTGVKREKQVTFHADSKAQALAKREALLEAEKDPAVRTGERVRFAQASEAWAKTITVHSTSRGWGRSHRKALDAHFGDWWLDAVSLRAMQDHLNAMSGSAGHVNSRRCVLISLMDFAVSKSWLATNPARDLRRRSTRVKVDELEDAPRKALTTAEASAVLADLRENDPEVYPLCLTQLVLGCRFAEVSALRREDIDLDTGIVRIRRGQWLGVVGPTKGRYARTAGLPLDVRAVLRAHLDRMAKEQWSSWETLVFPRPPFGYNTTSDFWAHTTVSKALHRSFKRVGISVIGTTHVWRHTLVTMMSEHASEQLLRKVVGHASPEVHAKYRHAHDAEVIVLADKVGRSLSLTGTQTGTQGEKGDAKPRK